MDPNPKKNKSKKRKRLTPAQRAKRQEQKQRNNFGWKHEPFKQQALFELRRRLRQKENNKNSK